MNREIKFKCWDKIINQMFVPTMINRFADVRHNGVYNEDCSYGLKGKEFETWLNRDSFEWLQFTGLKDKSGKEIYEGDIIMSLDSMGIKIIHKIRYNTHAARFDAIILPYMSSCGINQGWIDEFKKEVIGNIYESPELLNK